MFKFLDSKSNSIFGYPFGSFTSGSDCNSWCDVLAPPFGKYVSRKISGPNCTRWHIIIGPIFSKFGLHERMHMMSVKILRFKFWDHILIPIWEFYVCSGSQEMMQYSHTSFSQIRVQQNKAPHEWWNTSFQNMSTYLNTHLRVSQVVWIKRDNASLLGPFLAKFGSHEKIHMMSVEILGFKIIKHIWIPIGSFSSGLDYKRWCDVLVPPFGNYVSCEKRHPISGEMPHFKLREHIWIPIWEFHKWSRLHEMAHCSWASFWKIWVTRNNALDEHKNSQNQNLRAYWISIWVFYELFGLQETMWYAWASFLKISVMRNKALHEWWNDPFQNLWPYLNTNLGVSRVVQIAQDNTLFLGLFWGNSSHMKECTWRALKFSDSKSKRIFRCSFGSFTTGLDCKRWFSVHVPPFGKYLSCEIRHLMNGELLCFKIYEHIWIPIWFDFFSLVILDDAINERHFWYQRLNSSILVGI